MMQMSRGVRLLSSLRLPRSWPVIQRKAFHAPSGPLKADLVQDLYLRELKSYKPAPVQPSDAESHVKKFTVPKAPSPPEEGDLARDLKAYEDAPVEVEGALAPGEKPVDKFAQFLEDELKFYEEREEEEHH